MTSLKRRLDNVLVELDIIREELEKSGQNPPCCLILNKNGKISCDAYGPLPKADFLKKCQKCRTRLEKFLAQVEKRSPKYTA